MKLLYFLNLIFFIQFPLISGGWKPEVVIKNGTLNQSGKVDSLKLIAISSGMQPIAELAGFDSKMIIDKIDIPDESPILFQAKYKGATYNKMVPPAPNFRNKPIEIIVYETTTNINDIDIKSVIQINREEDSLRFIKVYIFDNSTNPPKSFLPPESLEVFIPELAQNLRGQYTQADSKMGIPLSLDKGNIGRKFDRAILPGQSDLVISYNIQSNPSEITEYEDRILFEKENGKVYLLNPPEMKIKNKNSSGPPEKITDSGPDGMAGLKVMYNNGIANIEVSGGKPLVKETPSERKVVNGTIFINWINSTYGVLAVMGILFSLSFIFVYNKK
jgi:hypothetical protein